ncbi:hypothetical protein AAVH_23895 [Aphelenchoides avenae]|nr:hypothetical protein AAVH_23895 [Aphelenchus avenae]
MGASESSKHNSKKWVASVRCKCDPNFCLATEAQLVVMKRKKKKRYANTLVIVSYWCQYCARVFQRTYASMAVNAKLAEDGWYKTKRAETVATKRISRSYQWVEEAYGAMNSASNATDDHDAWSRQFYLNFYGLL